MDVGPVHVGPSEAFVAVLLGLIAAVVLVSLVVMILWGIALLVVAPTLTTISTRVRRRRQHNRLRKLWLASPHDPAPPEAVSPQRPPVCGVSVVCHRDAGAHLDLVAARFSSPAGDHTAESPSIGMVRVAVRPSSRLDLMPDPYGNVAVMVVAGRGTAGVERRPVCAGQVAVFGPQAPVTITADAHTSEVPLEVLVLSKPDTDEPAPEGEVTVVDRSPAVQRRLAALKALVDRPLPSEVAADAAVDSAGVDAAAGDAAAGDALDVAVVDGATAPDQEAATGQQAAARDEVVVPREPKAPDRAAPAA